MGKATCDEAAERMGLFPITLVIGIAEKGLQIARAEMERDVNHLAGIGSIERPQEKGFVCGEGCGVDANTDRQRENGDRRESGIATQNAGSVAQILENGLRQDHQIDFAHPLAPETRVAEASQRVASCLLGRHAGGQVVFDSHLGVRAKLSFDFPLQFMTAEKI